MIHRHQFVKIKARVDLKPKAIKPSGEWYVLLRTVLEINRIRYLPIGKGRRIVKIPRPFFLTSTASVDTDAIISYEL